MYFPSGPSPSRFVRMPAPRRSHGGPVFAVGHTATIAAAGDTQDVVLMDALAMVSHGTLALGARVEILAWQPAAAQGPRYRVRSSSDGIEGWLNGRHLRMSEPPIPTRTRSPEAPAKRIARVKKPVAKATAATK